MAQSLFGELLASRRKNLSRVSCASRVPLGMEWGGTCAGDGDVPMVCLLCGVMRCGVPWRSVPVVWCVALCCIMSSRVVSCLLCCCLSVVCVLDCHCCVASIMNRHEHNRSWKGMFCAKKNKISRPRRFKKKTVSVIVQKLPHKGLKVHHGTYELRKKPSRPQKLQWLL